MELKLIQVSKTGLALNIERGEITTLHKLSGIITMP